ncbi:MAG: FmdB family zinc ribbon protein [Gemmatimonadaceae bacterium]
MPLYEFRCPNGHDFEKFYRSIGTASAEEKCPVCAEIGARLMSAAGLVFKGSGFYITDYGKDGKKAERDAASAAKTAASEATAKADKSVSTTGDTAPGSAAKPGASESAPAKSTESSGKPAAPASDSKPAKAAAPKTTPGKTA